MNARFLFAPAVGLLLVGCNPARAGLGTDTGRPTGDPFSLPANVSITGTIIGNSSPDCVPTVSLGDNEYVTPCFTLTNAAADAIEVTFPPRLVFISEDNEVQHGLVLVPFVVSVPGNGAVVVRLAIYCLNGGREVSRAANTYVLGPLTTEPGLVEITQLLDGKDISADTDVVQQAVWEVTEDLALSPESRAILADL